MTRYYSEVVLINGYVKSFYNGEPSLKQARIDMSRSFDYGTNKLKNKETIIVRVIDDCGKVVWQYTSYDFNLLKGLRKKYQENNPPKQISN